MPAEEKSKSFAAQEIPQASIELLAILNQIESSLFGDAISIIGDLPKETPANNGLQQDLD